MEVRVALPADLEGICEFGATYIPQHYGPLLGAEAAQAQVDIWWNRDRMSQAVGEGRVVLAEDEEGVIGVGEWSLFEGAPVIWKLYVHPLHRGEGIGPRLMDAIIEGLQDEADHIQVEHFAVNLRAGAFYEREGFKEIRTVEDLTNPVMNVIWRERTLD
ncbi:MAG TPA: GNAT family N-acetyltransferase [Acidimicrobiia bacterium]|nr:GNAT family N-acetyltransferase [Acidimicrobiia bacterium]